MIDKIKDGKFDGINMGVIEDYPNSDFTTHRSCIACPNCGRVDTCELDKNDPDIEKVITSVGWRKTPLTGKWYCGDCSLKG